MFLMYRTPLITIFVLVPCCLTLQSVALNFRIQLQAKLVAGRLATRAIFRIPLFELHMHCHLLPQLPPCHQTPRSQYNFQLPIKLSLLEYRI